MRTALRLLLALLLLVYTVLWLSDHWHYNQQWPDIARLMTQHVSSDALRRQIQTEIDADRPAQARMYLALAQRFGYAIDPADFATQLAEREGPWHSAWRETKAFSAGYVTGEADSTAGVAGALVSDFTVVGDARDLWHQFQHYRANEPVDDLVVALAGTGVALTAASVGSAGMAAPARAGVSLLKLAARTRRLSSKFRTYLQTRASRVFDGAAFLRRVRADPAEFVDAAKSAYRPAVAQQLETVASRVNRIREQTSTATTLALLRYVDSPRDLRGVERLAERYGPESRGIMRFLGKAAIRSERVLRTSLAWFGGMFSLLFSALASVLGFLGLLRVLFRLLLRLLPRSLGFA